MKLVRKQKVTPDSLRAMWAAIPGVVFTEKKNAAREHSENAKKRVGKATDTTNYQGKPRKHPVGHPGEEFFTVEEALEVLKTSRANLIRLAKETGVHTEIRQMEPQYKSRVFYLKEDIFDLKEKREKPKESIVRERKYEAGHPGNRYYSVQQARELLQISKALLCYFAEKLKFNTVKRLIKMPGGQYAYPPSTFYLKTDIRELNKKIRSL